MRFELFPYAGCKGNVADLGHILTLLVPNGSDIGLTLLHYRDAMFLATFQLDTQITIVVDTPFPRFVLVTNLSVERAILEVGYPYKKTATEAAVSIETV